MRVESETGGVQMDTYKVKADGKVRWEGQAKDWNDAYNQAFNGVTSGDDLDALEYGKVTIEVSTREVVN